MKKLYLLVLAMLLFALASAYFLKPGPKSDAPVLTEFASDKKVRYHVAATWARKLTSYKISGIEFKDAAAVIKELEAGGCKFGRRTIPVTDSNGSVSQAESAFCIVPAGQEVDLTLWSGSDEISLTISNPIKMTDPELLRAQQSDPNSIVQVRPAPGP